MDHDDMYLPQSRCLRKVVVRNGVVGRNEVVQAIAAVPTRLEVCSHIVNVVSNDLVVVAATHGDRDSWHCAPK